MEQVQEVKITGYEVRLVGRILSEWLDGNSVEVVGSEAGAELESIITDIMCRFYPEE